MRTVFGWFLETNVLRTARALERLVEDLVAWLVPEYWKENLVNCIWMAAVWVLLVCSVARFSRSRRDAVLGGSVVFGVVLLAITEALSAVTLLYFNPLLLAWILATVAAAIFCAVVICRTNNPAGFYPKLIPVDGLTRACLACIVVVACIVGLTAILAPPNNWDSMTYHMARVANWVQHRTVAHYPTQILRQLYLGPWSEFAVANVQIFVGSDRLAGCVQFISMMLGVVGVTLIAAKLGVGGKGQAAAGLFAATIPMMILQASSTQTDCVAALWVVCAINFGSSSSLKSHADAKPNDCMTGLATGLAFLTKATTAFTLAPFLLWLFIIRLRAGGVAAAGRFAGALIVFPILLNAPHFYRNYRVFDQILVPSSEAGWYQNSIHTPAAISSNIMRNLLMNTGFRGMGRYPALATKAVEKISGLSASDPRITYPDTRFRFSYTRDEHDAGNPMHLLLGSLAIALAVCCADRNRSACEYAVCLICGFVLFCLQLKWQPWITRLQLPMFVMMAPLFGLLIDRVNSRVAACITGLLFVQSFIYLIYGAPRTLIGGHNIFNTPRADQYFSKRPDLRNAYQQAARIVGESHPPFAGLICGGDSWEYAVRSQLPAGIGIIHLGASNQSRVCPTFSPVGRVAWIIRLDNAPVPLDYAGYRIVYQQTGISVLHTE